MVSAVQPSASNNIATACCFGIPQQATPEVTLSNLSDEIKNLLRQLIGGPTFHQPQHHTVMDTLPLYGGPDAAANSTHEQRVKYAEAFKAGYRNAANEPNDALYGNLWRNTNPVGMHDSRDMNLINSNPGNQAAFTAKSPAEKEQALYEADFYLRGMDRYAAKRPSRTITSQDVPGGQIGTPVAASGSSGILGTTFVGRTGPDGATSTSGNSSSDMNQLVQALAPSLLQLITNALNGVQPGTGAAGGAPINPPTVY